MSKYTQKAILYTFRDMLETTPFDKITVSALVSRCEISSNTFYYHFRDIYDLLDTWLLLWKEKYVARMEEDGSWQDPVKSLLRDMKAHSNIVYHLSDSLSRERIERSIFESTDHTFYQLVCRETAGVDIPEEVLRNVAEYNTYAFLGFFLKFLWNRMTDDIDEMIDQISENFENNLQWVIAKYQTENKQDTK